VIAGDQGLSAGLNNLETFLKKFGFTLRGMENA
jgi:hypothetical protein